MRGTWIRIIVLLGFVMALAVAGGWWMLRSQAGGTVTPEPRPVADAPKPATSAPAPAPEGELTLPGVIEPYESVPVSANLTASIASLKVREGSAVAKGQLLCVLDDTDLRREIEAAELVVLQSEESLRRDTETRRVETERKRLSLATVQRDLESYRTESELQRQETEASVARAERELRDGEELLQAKAISAEAVRAKREKAEDARRAQEQRRISIAAGLASREKAVAQAQLDAGTQSVSDKSLQAARLGISKAQAELAERRRKLADTRVIAPIGGTIHIISRTRSSSMSASGPSSEVLGPGVRVFEGDPFLEIATTERACVRIDVDETDIGRIARGTPATITGDAFPGVRLKGEVTEIQTSGKKAGQGVSLFPVTVLITSPLRGVHMGMTADVGLVLGARESGARR